MKIEGSVALVTGANRGFGKAFVQALLNAGAAKVHAAARDPAMIEPAERVVPVKVDVTNADDILTAVARCQDVNLLINNAGTIVRTPNALDPAAVDALRQEFAVNVFGPLQLTQAFAPVLKANGGGAVLNILSALSWISVTGAETYCASKAAAWSLTNGLRHVLTTQGTQVAALHVGYMDTDMARDLTVPKSDPLAVAKSALEAIGRGESEILADPGSVFLKKALGSGVYLKPMPRG